MAKFNITVTETFKDNFGKLSPEEQTLVERKVELLSENPSHPSLRCKRVEGKPGYFESSANMDIRMIWRYEAGGIIAIVDIGHHDVLRKY
jgi:mRNA-degrading endonuclease RelE of RelBE toxin-antitoxin system